MKHFKKSAIGVRQGMAKYYEVKFVGQDGVRMGQDNLPCHMGQRQGKTRP